MENRIHALFLQLILFIAVASVIMLGVSYWSGSLTDTTNPGAQKYEKLEIANVTSMGTNGSPPTELFKISVKNTGTADSKLEYLVVNGTVKPYGSKDLEVLRFYSSSEYLVIPYNSQAEVYFRFMPNQYSHFEIRLHTVAGNDFSQVLTILRT